MMVVGRRKVGIPASLMTHSHYLTHCVLAIAGWRGLGLHETRKIQESRGTRNSSDMKIGRTLIRRPQAAGMLFGRPVRIGDERCRGELMRWTAAPQSSEGEIAGALLRPFVGGAPERVSWHAL